MPTSIWGATLQKSESLNSRKISQQGFSLVEILLASMIAGMMMMAGVSSLQATKKAEFSSTENRELEQSHYVALQMMRNTSLLSEKMGLITITHDAHGKSTEERRNPVLDRCLAQRPRPSDNCNFPAIMGMNLLAGAASSSKVSVPIKSDVNVRFTTCQASDGCSGIKDVSLELVTEQQIANASSQNLPTPISGYAPGSSSTQSLAVGYDEDRTRSISSTASRPQKKKKSTTMRLPAMAFAPLSQVDFSTTSCNSKLISGINLESRLEVCEPTIKYDNCQGFPVGSFSPLDSAAVRCPAAENKQCKTGSEQGFQTIGLYKDQSECRTLASVTAPPPPPIPGTPPPPPPTPVDCVGAWSACSTTAPYQRVFTIATPAASGGVACPVSPEACSPPPPTAKIDCAGYWSACTTSAPYQRLFNVTTSPANGGAACPVSPQACVPSTTTNPPSSTSIFMFQQFPAGSTETSNVNCHSMPSFSVMSPLPRFCTAEQVGYRCFYTTNAGPYFGPALGGFGGGAYSTGSSAVARCVELRTDMSNPSLPVTEVVGGEPPNRGDIPVVGQLGVDESTTRVGTSPSNYLGITNVNGSTAGCEQPPSCSLFRSTNPVKYKCTDLNEKYPCAHSDSIYNSASQKCEYTEKDIVCR